MITIKSHNKKHADTPISHQHTEQTHEHNVVKSKGRISRPQKDLANVWKIATIALAILFIASVFTHGFSDISINFEGNKKTTTKIAKGDSVDNKLDVELYVMSQCPYGVQAQAGLIPAVQALGQQNFNLAIEFISTDLGGGQFNSLHGDPETKGNIAQLCGKELDESKYLDLILCMNKDMNSIPNNWEACAESLGYNIKEFKTCYEGSQGKELLSESVKKTTARGATGSPTIYVNNLPYGGGREELDFKRAFCNAFESERPQACSDIPLPVEFEMIVLNDKTCASCGTVEIVGATRNFFPGVQVREVDVSSTEGKNLVNKYAVEVVPTYIFTPDVIKTDIWEDVQFQTNFRAQTDGSYILLNEVTGASYFISEEKRLARLAAMDIVTGDNKPQIDFFIMSYCPYGNQAVEAMTGTFELMKDFAEFNPRYIYYANYGGGGPNYCLDANNQYCAMHGIVEAKQNVREQCVLEKYGIDAWFTFANEMITACSSANADTCYVGVANRLGYDASYIAECETTKAITYATEDARLMGLFGASGSPAVYIDGAEYTGPRTATGYQAALCAAFEKPPKICEGIVVTQEAAPAAQGSC